MADLHLLEDEAALYVVGELTAAERASFEARLAQSAELRALVRDLEEGVVALALATPRRHPPSLVWQRIEKAVARETGQKAVIPAFWSGWWRNGWAAAAACLVGWLIHAFWLNRPAARDIPTPTLSSETHSPGGMALTDFPGTETRSIAPAPSPMVSNATYQLVQARTLENEALRQLEELRDQVSHLSQTLAQQQALLTESNRLKFFQLRPASDASGTATTVQLSPALQRAISMAMAREVGWVPSANPTNQFDIDFVDFRPNTNGTPSSLPVLPKEETPATEVLGASSAPIATNGTIPAFVSGNNIVVAIDSTIAPSGSQLTFSAAPDNQAQQTLGTTILGDNPLVVTLGGFSTNGGTLTITAGTFVGPSNIFHTYIPGTRPP